MSNVIVDLSGLLPAPEQPPGKEDIACSWATRSLDEPCNKQQEPFCAGISAAADRLVDLCVACRERLAHKNCDTCDGRICNVCVVPGNCLPLSSFCSSECRDEAELAAENARQADIYARWR